MKALTISQPFASLIADAEKFIENRTWATNYRGPLAIHAGKGSQFLTKSGLAGYPTGAVVAIVDLVACLELEKLRDQSRFTLVRDTELTIADVIDHEYTEGPFCWVLQNPRKLETPVRMMGSLGLWNAQLEAEVVN